MSRKKKRPFAQVAADIIRDFQPFHDANFAHLAHLVAGLVPSSGTNIPAFVIDTGARLLAGTVADDCKHPVLRPGDLFLFNRINVAPFPLGEVVKIHTSTITHVVDEQGMHAVGGWPDAASVTPLVGIGIISRYEAIKALDLDGKA